MDRKNIWIDCDPGIDDAVALAMAAASRDKLKIWGISTVAGNQTGQKVTQNALKLAGFLGLDDVPVVQGASEPLMGKMETADDVHGEDGLGNCRLPDTERSLTSRNGILYMGDFINGLNEEEKITLVPTGPLTNIALLLKVFPRIKEKIGEIVLMGGSSVGGNVTETAEFNIWTDPEAAAIVFQSGLPIVMCGLDVTRKCGLYRSQAEGLLVSENKVKQVYGQMLEFYFNSPSYKDKEIACIHDAVTILYLTDPELFGGVNIAVEVDWTSKRDRGRTICKKTDKGRGVYMLNSVDLENFQKVMLDKFQQFS